MWQKRKKERKKRERERKRKKSTQTTWYWAKLSCIVSFKAALFLTEYSISFFFVLFSWQIRWCNIQLTWAAPPPPPPPFPGLSCSNWYKSRAQTKDNSWLLSTSNVITELPPLCHVRFVSQLASPVTSTQVVHRWLKVVLTDFRLDTSDGLPSHNLRRWRRTNES